MANKHIPATTYEKGNHRSPFFVKISFKFPDHTIPIGYHSIANTIINSETILLNGCKGLNNNS